MNDDIPSYAVMPAMPVMTLVLLVLAGYLVFMFVWFRQSQIAKHYILGCAIIPLGLSVLVGSFVLFSFKSQAIATRHAVIVAEHRESEKERTSSSTTHAGPSSRRLFAEEDIVVKGQANSDGTEPTISAALLYSPEKPDWVVSPESTDGKVHRIAVSTDLLASEEECREQLDTAILEAARRYANEHVLADSVAGKLHDLNVAWVRENWLVPNRQWATILDRPSGTYYQLWVQLEIFQEDREKIRSWYSELETRRKSLLCIVICLSVGVLAGALNMGLRVFRHPKSGPNTQTYPNRL
jgi:GTP cyclohydrolase II